MNDYGKRRSAAPSVEKNSSPSTPHSSLAIGIDLGSNTLRAVKRDCETGEFVAEYERIVRTADGLTESGRITAAAVDRVVEAIGEAKDRIGFEGARIRAVTTEALRRAENRAEVLKRIEEETGICFELISGEEEARLTLLAVETRLRLLGERTDSFILVDIGGGSTELIFHYADEVFSRSFPLGIVTLSQEAGNWERVGEVLEGKLPPLRDFVAEIEKQHGRPEIFVATAGTPTTVAAMKLGMNYATYDGRRVNGTRLKREELELYLRKLLAMSRRERERAVGVGRDDLIAAGILIFEALYVLLGFDECIVIDDGLREGAAIELCEKAPSTSS
ncbi:Ppx/GppA phosphatase family protein [Nitratifractor sp.]